MLKEKEIGKYGEYCTHRLVLEAYDRLRPHWDMETHLHKLNEIWEECQQDLSKPTYNPENSPPHQLYEPDTAYGGLFDQGEGRGFLFAF